MKKDTKDKEIMKDEELTDEELSKAAGGYVQPDVSDSYNSTVNPGKVAGGNSIENIGSEFASTVKPKR